MKNKSVVRVFFLFIQDLTEFTAARIDQLQELEKAFEQLQENPDLIPQMKDKKRFKKIHCITSFQDYYHFIYSVGSHGVNLHCKKTKTNK